MSATIRLIIVVFVVMAVCAPWAIHPFIDGMGQFAIVLRDTISHLRDSHQ